MQTEIENSPTADVIEQTETKKSTPANSNGQTKTSKSPAKGKGGRPKRETAEPAKWTVRGVEPETRSIIEKAAKKHDKTLGQFFNDEIRAYCTGQIKKSNTPPASPDDIRVMVQSDLNLFKSAMQAEFKEDTAKIIEAIEKSRNVGIVTRIRQALFGK